MSGNTGQHITVETVVWLPAFCAPCMGNNLAVEVRYALGSRER